MTAETSQRILSACCAVVNASGTDAREDAMLALLDLVLRLPCDEWPHAGRGIVTTCTTASEYLPPNVLTLTVGK